MDLKGLGVAEIKAKAWIRQAWSAEIEIKT
jgi:hypothetical protein